MASKKPDSSPTPGSRSDTPADGGWMHRTAKMNIVGAIGVALVTGLLAAVTAYIAKPATSEPGTAKAAAPSSSPAKKPTIRFDPVDRPVGICNFFNGTGDWDPETTDLLFFNRPWDEKTKEATDNYYLDGEATKLTDSTWKGPRQEIGRGTKTGFAVEVTAVVVGHQWAEFLLSDVTSPSGMYWAVKTLPPHEAAATLVVTRDGTTDVEC